MRLIARSRKASGCISGLFVLLLVMIPLFVCSCSRNFERVKFSSSEAKAYLEELSTSRLDKDIFFKTDPSSPLTNEQKAAFKHLNYYPPNLSLIFRVKLVKQDSAQQVGINSTGGEVRRAIEYGRFEFEVDGKRVGLYVYKMADEDSDALFLPFTDKTCSSPQASSYSGGRYIDLIENESESYNLDFNYAYNPYCAYSRNFSCPIVPQENQLDVPIAAGEMKY